jgi:hypothetical protein
MIAAESRRKEFSEWKQSWILKGLRKNIFCLKSSLIACSGELVFI